MIENMTKKKNVVLGWMISGGKAVRKGWKMDVGCSFFGALTANSLDPSHAHCFCHRPLLLPFFSLLFVADQAVITAVGSWFIPYRLTLTFEKMRPQEWQMGSRMAVTTTEKTLATQPNGMLSKRPIGTNT